MSILPQKRLLSVTSALVIMMASTASAETLQDRMGRVLSDHQLIRGAKDSLDAAQHRADREHTKFFPTVSLTANAGRETYRRDEADDSTLSTRDVEIRVDQLVYDFGALSAGIDSSDRSVDRAQLEVVRQEAFLLLSAAQAGLEIQKARQVLEFAMQSVQNIKKQTDLEDARISGGQGYTTDLLQAKSQLAGAEARVVSAQDALERAQNRYVSIFGELGDENLFTDLTIDPALLPENLEQAIEIAQIQHPNVVVASADVDVANADYKGTKISTWAPVLNFKATGSNKYNPSGVKTKRDELYAGLELNWAFNTALGGSSAVAAAGSDAAAAQNAYYNTLREVREDVTNAWSGYHSAQKNADLLNNQADIVAQFLELARKEREIGRRSLLDVLNGETSLINAQSDAAAAKTDVTISALNLLLQIGKMDVDLFAQ